MSARKSMNIFHVTIVTDDVRLASLARGTAMSNRSCGQLRIALSEQRKPIISRRPTDDRLRIAELSGKLGGARHPGLRDSTKYLQRRCLQRKFK